MGREDEGREREDEGRVREGQREEMDAPEYEALNALGVRLGVCERQCRAPRASKDVPLVDGELLPEAFNVLD